MGYNDEIDAIAEYWYAFEAERHANPGDVWGIPSGFSSYDHATGGFHKGELVVIGGMPSDGKSTLVMQFAINVANYLQHESRLSGHDEGIVVALSPEMHRDDIILRLACQISGIDAMQMKKGLLNDDEREIWREGMETAIAIVKKQMYLDGGHKFTLNDIKTILNKLSQRRPIRMVIVDYLSLIHTDTENEYRQITDVSNTLKQLANEFKIPFIVISQYNRQYEIDNREKTDNFGNPKKRREPQGSDLRGSGAIAQDADVLMFIVRDDAEKKQMIPMTNAEPAYFLIKKNRNGPRSRIAAGFVPGIGKFIDLGPSAVEFT